MTPAQKALAEARPDVYWTDRPDRPTPRPALTGSGHRTDLLIVGAGYTGLWAAIQAKEDDPSREVTVVDAGRVGIGASGRNGGFASPSLTHGLAQGLSCWPEEIVQLQQLAQRNLTEWQDSLRRYRIEADYHQPGELTMALTPHQIPRVRESFDVHREYGIGVELLSGEQCRARVDSPRYLIGMFNPDIGLVDPARLVWGLAAAAESLGVAVHEDTAVTGFERDASGIRVSTEWGAVHAHRVLLGTNAHPVLRRFRAWVLPVYDHVLMSEPLTAEQLARVGWSGREGLTDAGNQFHYYRRTLDDRVLFGGYDANYHFPGRIDPAHEQAPSHDLLAEHFFSIFPQWHDVRFTHRWAGVIDTTSRFTPIFGTALGGRLSYAVGFTGLGVISTRFGARVALDLVDGRDTPLTRLAMVRRKPVPFPPEPLRWPAVRATRAALAAEDRTGRRGPWLRLLDRFGVGFDS